MKAIVPALAPEELRAIRQLFEEYATSLPIDLAFQGFQKELSSLPGDYAAPRGALFLARVDGLPAGCIGLRAFADSVGELKRLYVIPRLRGQGLGRELVGAAVEAARRVGYRELVLDTLASMERAIGLYRAFGFEPTEAYYPNPFPQARYFRLSLKRP